MHDQRPSEFLCFDCMTVAEEVMVDEIASVECMTCGSIETLDRAVDDCFLFIVYGTVSRILSRHERPYRFRFMPASENAYMSKALLVASKHAA